MSPGTLTIAPAIADSFVIPSSPSVNAVPVNGWRGTLERGFEAGFQGGPHDHVLILRDAELSFGPAAIGRGGTAAVRAHIRFKSSLADAAGTELARISGDVDARDAATSPTPEAMTLNASQATEAMYEAIAQKIAHPDK